MFDCCVGGVSVRPESPRSLRSPIPTRTADVRGRGRLRDPGLLECYGIDREERER